MRAIWSGTISFGLVNIPVRLFSGSESHTLDLDMLRKDDLCPVKYARVCRSDGKEIPYENIVKGYKYKKGDYVVLEKEDFEKANVEKTNSIDIQEFVKENEVDTIFYEKPYYLEPDKGGDKPYALLREALKKSKKVGIANFVMRNREHIAVLKPYGDLLLLNQLRYHDEIRDSEELNLPGSKVVNDKELKMALSLIDQSTAKFKPKDYKDTYIEDLKKIIESKAKGKTPKAKGKSPQPSNVIDMMTLLKKSLDKKKKSAA
ncbi:MAG TPA: Ku protein [Ignavibacteriaceae bacterium]|jgi:DNA end-binding protein Ku|nr:Ku protein [Ignavibacteriaceae bacterium]